MRALTTKTFCASMLLWMLAPVLAVTAFNVVVDPLHLLPADGIPGVNSVKPALHNHDRVYKTVAITWRRPQAVILGSSRTNQALDPGHPAFGGVPAFNLSVDGTNIHEMRALFEHALATGNVKTAVVELDMRFFDDWNIGSGGPGYYLTKPGTANSFRRASSILKTAMSVDTLVMSVNTLLHQEYAPEFGSNGLETSVEFKRRLARYGGIRKTFEGYIQYLAPGESRRAKRWAKQGVGGDNFKGMDELRAIIRKATAHGVKLYLFISPSHALDVESIRFIYGWQLFEEWQRAVVRLVDQERGLMDRQYYHRTQDVSLWDFSGYNSVTTEGLVPVSEVGPTAYYWDESHYRVIVGNWVLDRMFGLTDVDRPLPADFGVKLSTRDIDAHLRSKRANAQRYRQDNVELVNLVQELCKAGRTSTQQTVQ